MQVLHTLARGAKAPVKLGLSAGGIGLSVMRAVIDEARRAVAGESSRAETSAQPPPPPAVSTERASASPQAPTAPPTPAERAPAPPPTPAQRDPAPPPPAERVPAAPPVPPPAVRGPAVPAVPPPGAKQVDDEPVPAAEVAEPGAEDGAGAEVHVDPPWEGYDAMTAADVRDRLVAADSSLAAAVALYESAGRARISVVRAAERRVAEAGRD